MTEHGEEQRDRLAAALRALRREFGLSTTVLASNLGWSQAKVSRTELGQTRPKPLDVDKWARATGADDAQRRELVELAEQALHQFTELRRERAPGRQRVQQDLQRLETAASEIRVFAPSLVVGLAQTRTYAEAVFRRGEPPLPQSEIGAVVDARLARQKILADRGKTFYLLMGEAALRRKFLEAPDMRIQLTRLIELSSKRNVSVGVIPFDADERVHQYHGFEIIGAPHADQEAMVSAVNLTRTINVRSADEIDLYLSHFDALREGAAEDERFRAFVQGVLAELPDD
jgi:transcriptional regulator with XRE-family HTH domain